MGDNETVGNVISGGQKPEGELRNLLNLITTRVPFLTTEDILEIQEKIIAGETQTTEALVEDVKKHVQMGWWDRTVQGQSRKSVTEKLLQTKEALDGLGFFTGSDDGWAQHQSLFEKYGAMAAGFPVMLTGFRALTSESDSDWAKQEREKLAGLLLANRDITNEEFDKLIADGFYDLDVSIEEAFTMVSDLGVPDDVMLNHYKSSTSALYRSYERERQRKEEIQTIREETTAITTDEQKLVRRRQFEALEKEKPGKYVWNQETGRIYEVGGGFAVDGETGEAVVPDETGTYPDGLSEADVWWEQASQMVTPWDENNIEEGGYYSMLEVVENPDEFHKGGIGRFTSGDPFLGGFASDYGIVQHDAGQQTITRGDYSKAAGDPNAQRQFFNQQIEAQVDRPWYDEGDQDALFAGRSPEAIAEEQARLVRIGAIEVGDFREGVWGDAESEAMEKMMVFANRTVKPLEYYSDDDWKQWWETTGSGGGQGRTYSAPTYRRLDPARAELTVQETMRRMLGRDASSEELADLGMHLSDMHRQSFEAEVSAERSEYNAQTAAYDSGNEGGGGEVQGVDWEAQFLSKFSEDNEAELARFDRTAMTADRQQIVGGALSNIMGKLGGGIGR